MTNYIQAKSEIYPEAEDPARERFFWIELINDKPNMVRSFFNSIGSLIVVLNDQGQILYFNTACENTFGYTYYEVKEEYLWKLSNPSEPIKILFPITSDGSFPTYFENSLITKHDGQRLISWNSSVICDNTGKIKCVICTGTDVTKPRQVETALRQTFEHAEKILRHQKDELQERLAFERAFKHIAETIVSNDSTDSILATMSRIVAETLKVDRSMIYHVELEKQQITRLCGWLNPEITDIAPMDNNFELAMFSKTNEYLWESRQWLESHEDDLFPQLVKDEKKELLHDKMRIKSLLWYPFLFHNDQGYYLLVVNQVSYRRTWRKREIEFLKSISKHVELAIQKISFLKDQQTAEEALKQSIKKLQNTLEETVNALTVVAEKRDPYTAGHQQRVAKLACAIAKEMGLPKEQIKGIQVAAMLHDIGKIYVPADILNKPGDLANIEMVIIKTHPEVGYDILKTIPFEWPVAEIALQHHERLNGSGYPLGLQGTEILLEARILAVADVVEAIASHRPYRPALGIKKAIEEIVQFRNIAFDADVVDTCVKVLNKKNFSF